MFRQGLQVCVCWCGGGGGGDGEEVAFGEVQPNPALTKFHFQGNCWINMINFGIPYLP